MANVRVRKRGKSYEYQFEIAPIDDEELKVATSGEIISAVLHNDLNFLPFLNSDKVMERF